MLVIKSESVLSSVSLNYHKLFETSLQDLLKLF